MHYRANWLTLAGALFLLLVLPVAWSVGKVQPPAPSRPGAAAPSALPAGLDPTWDYSAPRAVAPPHGYAPTGQVGWEPDPNGNPRPLGWGPPMRPVPIVAPTGPIVSYSPYRRAHPFLPCGHRYSAGGYYTETDPSKLDGIDEWCVEGDHWYWEHGREVFVGNVNQGSPDGSDRPARRGYGIP